jgi:hypothetical protein
MCKLLVKLPTGEQSIEVIDSTGEYFDRSRIMWDTRTQGEMPEVEVGKMDVIDGELVNTGEYLEDHAAAIYAKTVPLEVPMTAAREALIESGLFDVIDQFMSTQSQIDRMWWDKSTTIFRAFPLVETARLALGLTQTQIDDLFKEAERIRKLRSGEV